MRCAKINQNHCLWRKNKTSGAGNFLSELNLTLEYHSVWYDKPSILWKNSEEHCMPTCAKADEEGLRCLGLLLHTLSLLLSGTIWWMSMFEYFLMNWNAVWQPDRFLTNKIIKSGWNAVWAPWSQCVNFRHSLYLMTFYALFIERVLIKNVQTPVLHSWQYWLYLSHKILSVRKFILTIQYIF